MTKQSHLSLVETPTWQKTENPGITGALKGLAEWANLESEYQQQLEAFRCRTGASREVPEKDLFNLGTMPGFIEVQSLKKSPDGSIESQSRGFRLRLLRPLRPPILTREAIAAFHEVASAV